MAEANTESTNRNLERKRSKANNSLLARSILARGSSENRARTWVGMHRASSNSTVARPRVQSRTLGSDQPSRLARQPKQDPEAVKHPFSATGKG
jgi:hypothetical protein